MRGGVPHVPHRLTTAPTSYFETIRKMRCAFSFARETGGGSLETSRRSAGRDSTWQRTSRRIRARSWRWRRCRSAGEVGMGIPLQALSYFPIQSSRTALHNLIGHCRGTVSPRHRRRARAASTSPFRVGLRHRFNSAACGARGSGRVAVRFRPNSGGRMPPRHRILEPVKTYDACSTKYCGDDCPCPPGSGCC